jgi:hypothetical protein
MAEPSVTTYVPLDDDTVLLTLSPAVQDYWEQQARPATALTPPQRIAQARLWPGRSLAGSVGKQ